MSLWRAGDQARQQQIVEAERLLRQQAQALRRLLDEPAVLELVPASERFTAGDGGITVPAEVGWLDAAMAGSDDALLLAKVTAAQRAEFTAGDTAAAAAIYGELLGPQGPKGTARLPVAVAAAWQAERAGDVARSGDVRRELDAEFAAATPAAMRDESFARAASSALLLAAQRAEPLPAWAAVLVPAMPSSVAEPLLARLRERGLDIADLSARQRTVAAQRDLLRQCRQLLGLPSGSRHRDRLWLRFASGDGGEVRGALTDPNGWLAAAAQQLNLDAEHRVSAGHAPAGAEAVVDGLWYLLPKPPAELPFLAKPGAALAAIVTLALVFVGTGLLGMRALRQQAAAVRERAEFVTVVTHELKTPLAAIRLLAEMLVEDRVPAGKDAEYYRLLAGESARLSMLIENVLDLGRMERGERAYDLRECDLADVVREAAALFGPVAARDGLELRVEVAAGAAMARADRGALLQALLNVLDNARKYAAAGKVIGLSAGDADGRYRIVVRDFGSGVAEAERETIFARFRRGSAHRHGSIPGVGLGLHLARTIARRHGGDLVCRAPDGGGAGTEFGFALPLAGDGGTTEQP